MYTLSYDNGAAYTCSNASYAGPNQHHNNASNPRFINTEKNWKFCHACFVGFYNYWATNAKANRDETLKKREELEKAYELKIRKQIIDGALQIP